jgi:ketosteroid isomerase-like protein
MTEDSAGALMQLAMAYGKAWNNADTPGILALHTKDSVFQLHDGRPPAIGIDEVGIALREFFEQWSDASFARRSVFFGKENWAVEWTLTARPRGDGGRGSASPSVSFEGVDIVTVREGRVSAKHVYFDAVTVSKLLGAATA